MGRKILTKAVLATIPEMVARGGMRADDIAEKLGCNLGTLKVRCSQAKISLRPLGTAQNRRTHHQSERSRPDAAAKARRRKRKNRSGSCAGAARNDRARRSI